MHYLRSYGSRVDKQTCSEIIKISDKLQYFILGNDRATRSQRFRTRFMKNQLKNIAPLDRMYSPPVRVLGSELFTVRQGFLTFCLLSTP